MKILTLSLLVCATMAPTRADNSFESQDPSCPEGWTRLTTHCALYVPGDMTWAEAEENCKSKQGDLASVYNAYEAFSIREAVQRADQQYKQIWVKSYIKEEYPSQYVFSNTFSRCHGEDPENKDQCLQLSFEENESGCFDELPCDARLPSICLRPVSSRS